MSTDPRQTGEMPFLHHLEELRKILFQSLAACAVGAIAGWWLAPRVLEDLIHRTVGHVIVLSPLEALNQRLKLTLILGLALVLPYVLHRIWSFIVPGLFKRERDMVLPMVAASFVLFGLGVWAAWGYVIPLVLKVLMSFSTPSMTVQIQIAPLLDFAYNLALACGVVFQLPLVTMALSAMGLVTPKTLLRQWRTAIVLIFVITAAITPGDVVSAQLIMGIPMVALYFLSVGLAWFVRRRSAASRAEVVEEGNRA